MIERVAVVGAGTMGHGIAQVSAAAGCDVVLFDTTLDLAQSGLDKIRGNLDEGVARGKVSETDRELALARIRPAVFIAEEVADRDLVVEAIPERIELKVKLFSEIEGHTDAILASNTSSLSINEMQRRM